MCVYNSTIARWASNSFAVAVLEVAAVARRVIRRAYQPRLVREYYGLDAVAYPQLGQDAPDVGLHGGLGDEEPVCDLQV